MSHYIVDRRPNGNGKSSPNRKKLLDRVKGSVKKTVKEAVQNGNIADIVKGGNKVRVPVKDLREPSIGHGEGGVTERTIPGNNQKGRNFNTGDTIARPPKGGQGPGGAGNSGDGNDDFVFELTRDEFLEFFFEDLELPDLAQKKLAVTEEKKPMRNGFSRDGNPAALDLMQTMKSSISRRAALRTPKKKKLRELEAALAVAVAEMEAYYADPILMRAEPGLGGLMAAAIETQEKEIAELKRKIKHVPYVDDIDLRYRNWTQKPIPATQAVMFCVDGQTEYLSPTGWVKIDQYGGGKVAQYNADGTMEFVDPLQYVQTPYSALFIDIVGEGINQRLTQNHRFVYRDKSGTIKECLSQDVAKLKGWHSKNAVITSFEFSGAGIPLTDDEIRFHIAFKADGTYQQDATNRAQFCFTKLRKIERLKNILDRLGWTYVESKSTDRTWIYCSTIERISKVFDSEWYQANSSQLELIGEEVLHWDGCVAQNSFTAKSKDVVDYVQFVWATQGLGTRMYYTDPVWVVRFSQRNLRSLTQNVEISDVIGDDGMSYCFTVPSGMLVLRRSETIFVSGNCLMDVSGSMSSWHKDIAKRFYMLLYLFLYKNYEKVEIVFVRHHHTADEVDEQTFFYDRASGGTIVSEGLKLVNKIIDDRYDKAKWNVYVAQASDGDNWQSDHEQTMIELNKILSKVQFYFYIDINQYSQSDMFTLYKEQVTAGNFAQERISDVTEIYGVFRKLFEAR